MPLIAPDERKQIEALSRLAYCNPFVSERIDLERRILGDGFEPFFPIWHPRTDIEDDNPNVLTIGSWAAERVERLRSRLVERVSISAEERALYQDACLYVLYYRCHRSIGRRRNVFTNPQASHLSRRRVVNRRGLCIPHPAAVHQPDCRLRARGLYPSARSDWGFLTESGVSLAPSDA